MNKQIQVINKKNFEGRLDQKEVHLFDLVNTQGLFAQITNYGGRLVSLWTPDKDGHFADIVLAYDSLEGYLNSHERYYGALIGRFANRISHGHFRLNDQNYQITKNEGEHHLHGGKKGFHDLVWDAKQLSKSELELSYFSQDGEEGFPGNLNVKVVYHLTDENELKITYSAKSDKATPINLTHHSFFNLEAAGKTSIENHHLAINADLYLPINDAMIPTGKIEAVQNTPFDFLKAKAIGQDIDANHQQIKHGQGYDHYFILNGKGIRLAASVVEPISGRQMDVLTDEAGLQFYSGNFLTGKDMGNGEKVYGRRSAFCLEAQGFPDSPNKQHFPSSILEVAKAYQSTCIYRFKCI